jgi:hypothetical protein
MMNERKISAAVEVCLRQAEQSDDKLAVKRNFLAQLAAQPGWNAADLEIVDRWVCHILKREAGV